MADANGPTIGSRLSSYRRLTDHTIERTAALNQLLLGLVVLCFAPPVIVGAYDGNDAMFFMGVVVIFVVTAITLTVPWNRVPLGLLALVPAIDILAITAMRLAQPTSAAGL